MALLCFVSLSATTASYKGTGFTHNIPDNYYSSMSTDEILNKYNDTYLTSEKHGVCTKVVDGDTIYLDNGDKIRFVGVNTPEKGVTGYKASKNCVEKFCLNKEVDINVDDRKHSDKYGRTLGVVIVGGKNLNEMLLKEGLAEVMYIPPSEFSPYSWVGSSQDSALATVNNTNSSTVSANNSEKIVSDDLSSYIGNSNSHKFHRPDCKSVMKMSDKNKVTFNSREDAVSQGYTPCHICTP